MKFTPKFLYRIGSRGSNIVNSTNNSFNSQTEGPWGWKGAGVRVQFPDFFKFCRKVITKKSKLFKNLGVLAIGQFGHRCLGR